jgi:hypothetical protein
MTPSFTIQLNPHPLYGFEVVRATYIVEKRLWRLSAGGDGYHTPLTEIYSPGFEEAVERFGVKLAGVRSRIYCEKCQHPALDLTLEFDGEDPADERQKQLAMTYQCWWGAELEAFSICNARGATV